MLRSTECNAGSDAPISLIPMKSDRSAANTLYWTSEYKSRRGYLQSRSRPSKEKYAQERKCPRCGVDGSSALFPVQRW